jgi:hypothetical protein
MTNQEVKIFFPSILTTLWKTKLEFKILTPQSSMLCQWVKASHWPSSQLCPIPQGASLYISQTSAFSSKLYPYPLSRQPPHSPHQDRVSTMAVHYHQGTPFREEDHTDPRNGLGVVQAENPRVLNTCTSHCVGINPWHSGLLVWREDHD